MYVGQDSSVQENSASSTNKQVLMFLLLDYLLLSMLAGDAQYVMALLIWDLFH